MLNRLLPLAVFAAISFPASAGLFDDDEARKQIAEVRAQQEAKIAATGEKIAAANEKIDQLDARSSQKLVEVVGQLSELGQQIAQLRGQIEVLTFNLQNMQKRQQDLYVDLDGRIRALEDSRPKVATAAADAQNAQQEADAATAFEAAYNQYRDGKLKPAIEALQAVIGKYPTAQAAPSALFWLGMAQAQSGGSAAAQLTWRKLVDGFASHAKAPDALKGIATLQLDKGDKKAAIKTLKELTAAYPASDAAKEAEKQLKKL